MAQTFPNQENEVIYHVFQRSFYDSNGDGHGDLNGIRQKLDYLQDLGITSILMTPLHVSDCYHNYFADDFEKIDPEYGSTEDYVALVKEVHKRKMKIYLDMETQYVSEKHEWYKSAVNNLKSPFSNYILFEDDAHSVPSTMIFGLKEMSTHDGNKFKVTTVNLKSQEVLEYNISLFKYFMDPNKDGKFDDGADGFRLDHAMDNLDDKASLTHLLAEFWKPLITSLKKLNPKVNIVAEQADWNDYGYGYFEKGNVDRMFGFGLQRAILSFNKKQILQKADSVLTLCPKDKNQIIFLENHDLDRFASLESNIEKQKLAASLMLCIGGIPSIYYGQEIGMKGKAAWGMYGTTDGNDIPRREAFEWYKSTEGKGIATWYKNTGPWWTNTNLKANDGISFEEQQNDPNSLWNHYRNLIQLRKKHPALANGSFKAVDNNNDSVLSFFRILKDKKVLIIVNLSDKTQNVDIPSLNDKIVSSVYPTFNNNKLESALNPYSIQVWEVK